METFILGGTKGLGLELARIAIANNMSVTIAGRTADECELVKSGSASGAYCDLEMPNPLSLFPLATAYGLIIWSAGIHHQGSFLDLDAIAIERYARNHLIGPANALARLLNENKKLKKPCHLVVIGSSSSYAIRDDQAIYGALKAGKAQLARNLGRELPNELPGSKVLLAQPGGMATPFWAGREHMAEKFMNPSDVARVIWSEMARQTESFLEIHIDRQPDKSPKLEFGSRTPG